MSSGSLRDAIRAFTTTCALITTDGPRGPNVMAAEWTFNVSYRPFLILVAIDPANETHDMILAAGEFGVNLLGESQIAAMGFAGHFSKVDTDKLSSEAFETIPAKRIRAPMIRGAVLRAECHLVAHYPMGDHTAFVGEVIEFSVDPDQAPIVLHHGSHRLGERIVRTPGIVVAVTPARARRGSAVVATGELTGPERSGRRVEATVRDGQGRPLAMETAATGEDGSFQARLEIPDRAPEGPYAVVARSGGLAGHARLDVVA